MLSFYLKLFSYLCPSEPSDSGLYFLVTKNFNSLSNQILIMKRIVLPFFLSVLSFFALAAQTADTVNVVSDPLQVLDSMDLFHDITDISRQIEQRTTPRQDEQTVMPAITVTPQDSVPLIISPQRFLLQTEPGEPPAYINPLDSIYLRRENGTLQLPDMNFNVGALRGLTLRDTLFYSPLFLPIIFTGKMLPRDLSFYPLGDDSEKGLLVPQEKTFAPALRHIDFVQDVRIAFYKKFPDRISYSILDFDSIPRVESRDEIVRETFNPFRELLKTETTYSLDAPGVDVTTIDRKYWVHNGEHSFQFAQNYFSNNWHKGGTNNLNFNNYHIIRANYEKNKIKFNNAIEWRLSLFNAPEDSVRSYRIGNDLIRYYGDFGVNAFLKGWSYSTNMEAKSQLFNNFIPNTNDKRSSFLAPLYVNAGVGLKYEMNKRSEKVRHRGVKWTLALAPISINYKYVGNKAIDVKRYGIPEGRRSLMDIGSTITSILKYDFTRYITWDSRLTYFTSYEKVMSEFENGLNLSLSNAFSTRIYVNVRYDDGVPADPDFQYWQVNQTLSFGLNYKW